MCVLLLFFFIVCFQGFLLICDDKFMYLYSKISPPLIFINEMCIAVDVRFTTFHDITVSWSTLGSRSIFYHDITVSWSTLGSRSISYHDVTVSLSTLRSRYISYHDITAS